MIHIVFTVCIKEALIIGGNEERFCFFKKEPQDEFSPSLG
jgi:hypothetical protein